MRVVYLHGFLGGPFVWAEDDDALALPGHGGGPVWPSWHDNVSAVAAAIGECDAVVGYSLGARLALALVADHYVPRAVLISVNPGIDDPDRPARRAHDAAWARRAREDFAGFVDAWEAQPLFASQACAPEEHARRHARRLRHDPDQIARSLEVMGLAEMPDYRPVIARAPIALIAGADDAKYVAIARSFPVACELIAGSGHDPSLEQPAAMRAAIARLLRSPR